VIQGDTWKINRTNCELLKSGRGTEVNVIARLLRIAKSSSIKTLVPSLMFPEESRSTLAPLISLCTIGT